MLAETIAVEPPFFYSASAFIGETGMLIFPRERGTFPEVPGKFPRTLGREAGPLRRDFGPDV